MFNADKNLMEKWSPVLKAEGAAPIADRYKESVTARLLENQEVAMRQDSATMAGSNFISETTDAGNAGIGTVQTGGSIDPVLISLVRRAMPNLIAYDIAGVQPMTGPTGLIFAMKSNYIAAVGGARTEALFDEADTGFSGTGAQGAGSSSVFGDVLEGETSADATGDKLEDAFGIGAGMTTDAGELLGTTHTAAINAIDDATDYDAYSAAVTESNPIAEMGFSIEKTTVTAQTRALKANYTMELAQDLKAIHGLDAEGELANILSSEILAEINREVVRTVNKTAKVSLATTTGGGGTAAKFDLDAADGRWQGEKAKSLLMHIEVQANAIATSTRRGKGNYVICSANVASVLASSGTLDYNGAGSLNVDPTGNTFAGTLPSGIKVYVDPYATADYVTVGYRGSNPYDAGLFYCPYVPLQMVKAVGENDFQPRIGFKTRYGMVANPFVGNLNGRGNDYFRIFAVANINGAAQVGS
jgi:hypothetical protein